MQKNRFALNITKQWNGPDLLKMNQLGISSPSIYTAATHLQGIGNFDEFGPVLGYNWGLVTDTDLYLHAVPEPTSLALLSLGLMGFGFSRKRAI